MYFLLNQHNNYMPMFNYSEFKLHPNGLNTSYCKILFKYYKNQKLMCKDIISVNLQKINQI